MGMDYRTYCAVFSIAVGLAFANICDMFMNKILYDRWFFLVHPEGFIEAFRTLKLTAKQGNGEKLRLKCKFIITGFYFAGCIIFGGIIYNLIML